MRQFLNLNRHKLSFAFKGISLTFSTLILAVFLIAYFNGQQANIDTIVFALFLSGIVLPCFIIFISYLAWYYKQRAMRKAFSKPPFDQLNELGFSDLLLNEKTKWSFTEEVKAGRVNGFNLIADILYDKSHIIEVRAFTAWKHLDRNEYKRLSIEFKAHNIEFDFGSLVKRYNTKLLHVHTIRELKVDFEEFTELLKRNGFKPQTVSGAGL